jgi:PAS domain S-box-containing protein
MKRVEQHGGSVMNDHDKTRQQLVEELVALRQQLADRRQIADNLPVLVATAGLDGYYKEVNAAFERILGWSEQESLSRSFMEFILPEDHAAAVETFARLKAGEPVINFVDRNICKDGSHRWFNWIVIPVPTRDLVFGIGQDITERKRGLADVPAPPPFLLRLPSRLTNTTNRVAATGGGPVLFLQEHEPCRPTRSNNTNCTP